VKTNKQTKQAKTRKTQKIRSMNLETLEPRLLLSGDGLPVGTAPGSNQSVMLASPTAAPVEIAVAPETTDRAHAIRFDLSVVPKKAPKSVVTYATQFTDVVGGNGTTLFVFGNGSMIQLDQSFAKNGRFLYLASLDPAAPSSYTAKFKITNSLPTMVDTIAVTKLNVVPALSQSALNSDKIVLDVKYVEKKVKGKKVLVIDDPDLMAGRPANVIKIQQWMKALGYTDNAGHALKVDGVASTELGEAVQKLKKVLDAAGVTSLSSITTDAKFNGEMAFWYNYSNTPAWKNLKADLDTATGNQVKLNGTVTNTFGTSALLNVLKADPNSTGLVWTLGDLSPQLLSAEGAYPNTVVDGDVFWPSDVPDKLPVAKKGGTLPLSQQRDISVQDELNEWAVYKGTSPQAWTEDTLVLNSDAQLDDYTGFNLIVMSGPQASTSPIKIKAYDKASRTITLDKKWNASAIPAKATLFRIVDPSTSMAKKFNLTTDLVRAYWGAQNARESADFSNPVEGTDWSIGRVLGFALKGGNWAYHVFGTDNWKPKSAGANSKHVNEKLAGTAVVQAGLPNVAIRLGGTDPDGVKISSTDDYYQDCQIEITSGKGSGQKRRVIAYNGTTHVATVDSAWATVPDGTSKFTITDYSETGTALAMTTPTGSTIKLAPPATAASVTGRYDGYYIEITGGTGIGQKSGSLPMMGHPR